MERQWAAPAFAALLCVGCACRAEEPPKKAGPTHETVMQELTDNLNATTAILATIQDEATAQTALPKLIPLCRQRRDIWKTIKGLGDPAPDVEKALAEKHKPRLQAAMQKLETETLRLPLVGTVLKEARAAAEKDDAPKKAE